MSGSTLRLRGACPLSDATIAIMVWLLAALLTPPGASAQLRDRYSADPTAASLVPPSASEARVTFSGSFENCGPCGPTENGPMVYERPIPDQEPDGLPFDVTFGSEHCAALGDTLLYVVIATAAHPEGEARGRILYEPAAPTFTMTWGRIRMLYR